MIKNIVVFFACLVSLMFSLAVAQTPTQVKAVVFDFGGVIATTDSAKIIQFLMETFQLSKQELKPVLGKWKQVLKNGEDEKEFWENYAALRGIDLPKDWFEAYEKVTGFTDIPGMIGIVKYLQSQGFQTPMLSNIQHYQANVVRRFDYYDLFDPVLLSYEIGYEKPEREAFTFLLEKLQLLPSEVIFIDDKIENVESAKAVGIDAIQFVSPGVLVEELGERGLQLPKEVAMTNYTIVEKPEILLVGIECRTSNDPGVAVNDIPALWERFYNENVISQIPGRVSEEVIALYCDYEGDYTQPYSVVIGCPVSKLDGVPEGLVARQVPGGTFAAYRAIGEHPQTLIQTWGEIWQADLPRTYAGDYEVYGEKFTAGTPQEVEVFIAIEERSTPKRIAIIGNPGSGKSTFAAKLGALLDIPVHNLDTLAFVNGKKTAKQELMQLQKELVEQGSWIIEGCSISTLEMRFEKADMVIYLDISRIQCLWRVLKRIFVFDEKLANSGCLRLPNWALIKYIWNFEKEKKPTIFEVKDRYPTLNFCVLKNTRQIENFLKEWGVDAED